MAENVNCVPKEWWGNMCEAQQEMFNAVFERAVTDEFFMPPEVQVNDEQRRQVAWNAAWVAARCVGGGKEVGSRKAKKSSAR